jgi:hypothetical protein
MRPVRLAIAAAIVGGGLLVVAPSPASAAHCTDSGGPGNSDFATHVQATNGPDAHDEGDHYGWSSCEDTPNAGDTNPKGDR